MAESPTSSTRCRSDGAVCARWIRPAGEACGPTRVSANHVAEVPPKSEPFENTSVAPAGLLVSTASGIRADQILQCLDHARIRAV